MKKIYNKIGEQINKTPFKVLFIALGVAVLLIVGALNVSMATGNETLVKSDSEAFISNYEMEEEFGGDAIMVLMNGRKADLLSQETMEKMWNVEQRLQYNENIYSFLSPASIVHQITEKQGETIAENIPEISDGLSTMSENLTELGNELQSKDVPNPKEIEAKLDDMMDNLNAEELFGGLLAEQEIEMAKMDEQMGRMSGGLGEMGFQLASIGKELSSADAPNPDEITKKFNNLIQDLDPEKLMDEMMVGQKEELDQLLKDVQTMSAGLDEMGENLINIATAIEEMSASGSEDILEELEQLENLPATFDQLIKGQNGLNQGITELGTGLNQTSKNLEEMATSLKKEAESINDSEIKQQFQMTVNIISQSATGLSEMSTNAESLKNGTTETVNALTNMKAELNEMMEKIKASNIEGTPSEQFLEMANGLLKMGNNLADISKNIKQLPQKIESTLGQGSTDALTDMIGNMEKEIEQMKESLTAGISPDDLKSMSSGFIMMGDNLGEISSNMGNLPAELSGNLNLDPAEMFAEIATDLEKEVNQMKAELDSGISPEELTTMADGFITMGEKLEELSEALTTFSEKSGMMLANFPHNQKELDEILYDEDKLRDIFTDTIIDDEHVMFMIKLEGNLEDTSKDQVYKEVVASLEAENIGKRKIYDEEAKGNVLNAFAKGENDLTSGEIEYIISGKPVLDASLREEMETNMQFMVVTAAVVMIIVLSLVFRVRWRLLSIGVILVAVIATLGLMGHLSVPMTMVSMAVFPILIGLGIDFSIQFHNRYEEEKSVTTALTQTGKAILLAVFVSMLGFVSLYASPVPMIQDFGKMLTIGVVISFFWSVFILMPFLKARDFYTPTNKRQASGDAEADGRMTRILEKTTDWVTRFAPFIIIGVSLLAALGQFADGSVGVETDIETFMPQDMEALKDIRYVRDVVGSTDQIVLYLEDDNILREENITWIQDKTKSIEDKYKTNIEDVKSIDNLVANFSDEKDLTTKEYIEQINDLPKDQRNIFVSEDESKATIILNIKHMSTNELENFIEEIREDIADAPMDVRVTGQSVLDVEMVEGLTGGRVKMTFLGIALVFLGLFLVYRNVVRALVPVVPVFLVVGMSGGIMYLLGLSYTPITATLGALVLGMGTETTIMILERYIEERESGKNKEDALKITISRIGKATLSTEFTTMGGFGVLAFSNFVILKDFGLMTVISVSLILLSTFLVLPAVIWLLDRWIIREKDTIKLH